MTKEKDILKEMLVDETEELHNLSDIVKNAKEIFVMEKETGKIIFRKFSELTNQQRICCVLIAKYFANRLGLVNDHTSSVSEISNELDIPKTTLSSPLKSLRKDNQILYEKSRYRINPHRIDEIVNSLLTKSRRLK